MSGPALKRADSHAAIHEAALNEAIELTNMLEKLADNSQQEKAMELAYVLVEQWETRTLAHASSEEEGLYKDLVKENPDMKDDIVALTRDHDLLRLLVAEIKRLLPEFGVTGGVVQRFHSLIIVDELHNQKELDVLPEH
ncbi:hemerythrin domain-containing protein [Lentibacillus juripiscarius]|uniref:Hemerythrin domain-containing protein n=1 Tax=Lentibacillus juripiscarius TaxID=257446 RepID=A0ABW5V8D6_9BACI